MPVSDDLFTLSLRDNFPSDATDQKPFLLEEQQEEFWESSCDATGRVMLLSQANPEQQIAPLNIQGKHSEGLFSTRLMGCPMLPLLTPKCAPKMKEKKDTTLAAN